MAGGVSADGLSPAAKAGLRSQAMIGYVKAGLTGNQALKALSAQGLGVRRSTGLQLHAQLSAALDDLPRQAVADTRSKPRRDEMSVLSTKNKTGFLQYVDVYVVDRESGMVEIRPWVLKGDTLSVRQDVIDEALRRFTTSTSMHADTVVGAVYMGTYQMVPRGNAR